MVSLPGPREYQLPLPAHTRSSTAHSGRLPMSSTSEYLAETGVDQRAPYIEDTFVN